MPVNLFTPNMPASGNSLGFTRPLVLGNFGNYKENMEVNHLGVNSADFGKHKFLTMPNQGSTPTTSATEGGLFVEQVNSLYSVLFLQRENTAAKMGITIFPGSAGPSTFAAFTNIFDFSAIKDANHPNFFAIMQIMSLAAGAYGAEGLNGFVMIKAVTNSSTLLTVYDVILLGNQVSVLGHTLSYQFVGSVLQIKATPAIGASSISFTITPFYFPYFP